VNPSRGPRFKSSEQICDRFIRAPAKEDMHMVIHPIDFDYVPAFTSNCTAQIIMDSRTAILG